MRISDWSSDVCSSDLEGLAEMPDSSLRYRVVFSINEAAPAGEVNRSLEKVARYLNLLAAGGIRPDAGDIVAVVHGPATPIVAINPDNPNLALLAALQEAGVRSEERRVGNGCVSTCSERWWPDHEKKKSKK